MMYGDMMYTPGGLCMQALSLFLFLGEIWA